MSGLTISRRAVLAASALLAPGAGARANAGETPREVHMRLVRAPADRLVVALTLDACPGAFDTRIAAALVEARIPATIFATGAWLRRNPQGLALLLAHRDLFGIENHGARHVPPIIGHRRIFGLAPAGDLDAVRAEVIDGAAEVRAATGLAPKWYRAAAGYYSPAAIPLIRDMGFGVAGFSLNADMGASLPARSVARRIAAAAPGDVIVAHVNQPLRKSGEGVVTGVRALQARGARFVRLDTLAPADCIYY